MHYQTYLEEEEKKPVPDSILEQDPLKEFISLAEMSNAKFEVEKERDVKLINLNTIATNSNTVEAKLLNKFTDPTLIDHKMLKIPRKPKYKEGMTADQYKEAEAKYFIAWRKGIADFEEANIKLQMTLFEKNVAIWRQLWLTIEKSDVICQIVDARNPYFFMCPDLAEYINEVDPKKKYILLINKSDYLNDKQRAYWHDELTKKNVSHMFFSAKISMLAATTDQVFPQTTGVLNSIELLKKLKEISNVPSTKKLFIGMVGYPNVGKSSVINAIIGEKKVAVAEMPGKTKHMQTVGIDDLTTLLDCPGLVFPSLTNSYSEMVCNGVVPIDRLKEFTSPITLVIQRISKVALENMYKIRLPEKYNANVFLQILAKERGYVLTNSVADQAKTAKLVLKNYFNGQLLYCHSAQHLADDIHQESYCEKPDVIKSAIEKNVDNDFFDNHEIKVPVKEEEKHQKTTKWQRKQLKFAEKRGEKLDSLEAPTKKNTAKTVSCNEVFKNKPGWQGAINSLDIN